MKTQATEIYRKPITTNHPEIRVLFEAAEDRGIGTETIAELTGYTRDAILCLRRPRKDGSGRNPSFQFLKDVAQMLGYEFKLVPIGWRGQEAGD